MNAHPNGDNDLTRKRLEKESGFEAVCALCRWPTADQLLSDAEWRQVVSVAVARSRRSTWAQPALATAAVLALVCTLWALRDNRVPTHLTLTPTHDSLVTHVPAVRLPPDPLTTDPLTTDPIEEHLIRSADTAVALAPGRLGVVQFAEGCGALLESNTQVRTRSFGRSSLRVTLARGSALFSIEHGVFEEFAVETPHARVHVVGTIFRVSVDSARTAVSVLEGVVRVQAGGRSWVLTAEGEQGDAWTSDSAVVARTVAESQTLAARSQLLGSYLTYLARSADEAPNDSALIGRVDSLEPTLLALTPAVAQTEQLLLYTTARRLERAGSTAQALTVYRRLLADGCSTAANRLAALRAAHVLLVARSAPDSALNVVSAGLVCGDTASPSRELHLMQLLCALHADRPDSVLAALDGALSAGERGTEVEQGAFLCAQMLRLRTQNWQEALRVYSIVVDSFPQSRHREDAMHWAAWCLVQQGIERRGNRFARMYDSSYPEGSWRLLADPR